MEAQTQAVQLHAAGSTRLRARIGDVEAALALVIRERGETSFDGQADSDAGADEPAE